jgi:NAD(P)-dependent dehydrogenase (short-subunit alcohol dehydrogenase family)
MWWRTSDLYCTGNQPIMHINELFSLKEQVAFITGAASGIGYAMTEALAEAGAHVVMADINSDMVSGACARRADLGHSVEALTLDVGDCSAIHAAVDGTTKRHGRLDIVIANAGVSAGPGPLMGHGHIETVAAADWERVLRINLTGVFATIQAAATPMKRQGRGRIIATASTAGFRGDGMVGYAYVASKAAVANLVRQAAIDFAPHNVMVNGIAPGPFLTNIGGGRMRDEKTEQKFAQSVPLGRIGRPHEIKGAVLLLASPASSFMTGALISVDGGVLAC